jgi:hypothetical protein
MSPSSTALSSRTWCFASVTSYALSSPPKYRIVVSNTFRREIALVVKSIPLTAFTASANSSSRPMIASVSRVSTSVAPRCPKPLVKPPVTGVTSSCSQACFLYPFQECKKASLTAACLCSRSALLCCVSTPNSCCMRGIAEGVPVGRGIVEATVYLGGISAHLIGPLTLVEDVTVGNGSPAPRVSWRKAKYNNVVAIHSTPMRLIRGLIAAKIGVYNMQTICDTKKVANGSKRSSQEVFREPIGLVKTERAAVRNERIERQC